jgi:hypothetical protein
MRIRYRRTSSAPDWGYFCRCVNADAAADFSAFEEFGFRNTFEAMLATRADVFSFRAPMRTSTKIGIVGFGARGVLICAWPNSPDASLPRATWRDGERPAGAPAMSFVALQSTFLADATRTLRQVMGTETNYKESSWLAPN